MANEICVWIFALTRFPACLFSIPLVKRASASHFLREIADGVFTLELQHLPLTLRVAFINDDNWRLGKLTFPIIIAFGQLYSPKHKEIAIA